jgi:hypothetical protein
MSAHSVLARCPLLALIRVQSELHVCLLYSVLMQRQQQKQQQQHAGMNGAAAVHANANAGQQHHFDITDASPVVRDMWLYIQVRGLRCYSYVLRALLCSLLRVLLLCLFTTFES